MPRPAKCAAAFAAQCYDRLDDPAVSETERGAWQRLLREIDSARVSTIHAFCTALLRSHAAELGIDPTFGVLEQGEADVLRHEVIDDVLRKRLAMHDADTLDLAAEFRQLAQLKRRIELLLDQRHRPAFDRWLGTSEVEQRAKAEEMVAAWKQRHDRDSFRLSCEMVVEKAPIEEMLELLAIATPSPTNKKFPAAIACLIDLLSRLKTRDQIITEADLECLVANARVQSVCKKEDWPTADVFKQYGEVCTKLRDVINKTRPLPWNDEIAFNAALLGQKLLSLSADVAAAYTQRKLQAARLDFDDQLALAHRLLSDPAMGTVRDALSADLQLLLVDEFQDTDPLQVDLIKKICGAGFDEGRLFFVGDFKQSIYRFRGAVPPEFLKLRGQVPETGRLQLTRNFRSQPGVLHFVNALFHDTFDDYEALIPNRAAATDAPAVEFLWTTPAADQPKARGNVEEARRQEAIAIARRLRELMAEGCTETPVVDKTTGQPRRLRPADVAILFRALSDVRLYEEALREQGLEYYLVGGHAFYAQQEVFDVLNLLRAVASSADEISLAGVLRSPFFALADESLFWLVESGGSLNAGLFGESLPTQLSDEERPRVAFAARTLAHLRAKKDSIAVSALLNEALDLTGYDAVLVAEFLGERKLANLHKLIEHARTADQNGNDLNQFITQLTEFITEPPKEPLASTSAESADVVRLMTIHRAKGLEFPFVVVPDLDRPPRPIGPDAALDDELGPLVRIPSDENCDEAITGMCLFEAAERTAELDERKRLLYVACTRAADYLLLSSSIEKLDAPSGDWMKLIADRFDLTTGEFRGGKPPGSLPPDTSRRVHIAPPASADLKPVSLSRGADLIRMLDEAHALAIEGGAFIPPTIGPIPVDHSARRQFSFSRLNGQLAYDPPAVAAKPFETPATANAPPRPTRLRLTRSRRVATHRFQQRPSCRANLRMVRTLILAVCRSQCRPRGPGSK